ncbi:MAG: transglutaminaseTgpA domain-containing protein [Pseudomonadota bacterium]
MIFSRKRKQKAQAASPAQVPSKHTVTITVAAFLVAASPHLLAMPVLLAISVIMVGLWRVASAWQNWRAPHWSIRIALTFAALGAVILTYGMLWGRRAATAMLCLMIAAKLMEMFRTRDARQVAALAFFLVAAQFLFSQQLNLLQYLLITCWLATTAMYKAQRDDDRPLSEADNVGQIRPHIRQNWLRELRGGLLLAVLAIPFALVLSILFPRLASPLWGMPENGLDGRTGLAEEMSPGSIASLYIDDSPAFRVQFDGERPSQENLYWRGPVLWRFDGTTWHRLYFSNRAPERSPSDDNPPWRYRVQLEPNERNWMFTLDYPVRWTEEAELTADFQLVRKRPVTRLISYDVISQPNFIDSPELLLTLREIALRLPEDQNPRTAARAAEFRQQYPDDRELINAVLRWFNEDEFFYSLETTPLGRHGADEFLFDLKSGYCEYYASAFAILMRAAGIPARIVTGYQGGFWQQSSEYLLVRQSDAHAWVEVWLPGTGWTRVDPTAAVSPSRILENARSALNEPLTWLDAAWINRLRNEYDRLQHYWNQWVIDFNADRQQRFLSRIGLDQLSTPMMALLIVFLAMLTIAPIAFLLRGLGQARLRLSEAERLWRRISGRLKRHRLTPQIGETALEFAQRCSSELKNGDELIQAAQLFYRLHYAAPDTNQANVLQKLKESAKNWGPIIELQN